MAKHKTNLIILLAKTTFLKKRDFQKADALGWKPRGGDGWSFKRTFGLAITDCSSEAQIRSEMVKTTTMTNKDTAGLDAAQLPPELQPECHFTQSASSSCQPRPDRTQSIIEQQCTKQQSGMTCQLSRGSGWQYRSVVRYTKLRDVTLRTGQRSVGKASFVPLQWPAPKRKHNFFAAGAESRTLQPIRFFGPRAISYALPAGYNDLKSISNCVHAITTREFQNANTKNVTVQNGQPNNSTLTSSQAWA